MYIDNTGTISPLPRIIVESVRVDMDNSGKVTENVLAYNATMLRDLPGKVSVRCVSCGRFNVLTKSAAKLSMKHASCPSCMVRVENRRK